MNLKTERLVSTARHSQFPLGRNSLFDDRHLHFVVPDHRRMTLGSDRRRLSSEGERSENRASSFALCSRSEANLHGVQHPHHPVTDVIGDNDLDLVIKEKSSDARVVARRRPLIVETAPRHLDELPAVQHPVFDAGHGNPVRPTPPRINLSIRRYWCASDHVRMVSRLERAWTARRPSASGNPLSNSREPTNFVARYRDRTR